MNGEQVVGLVFGGIGSLMLLVVFTIVIYRRQFRQSKKTICTNATIVKHFSKSGSFDLNPVVNFKTEDGTEHEYVGKVATSNKRFFKGEITEIYYHRNNPKRFQLKAGYPIKYMGVFVSLFGAVFLAIGILTYFGYSELVETILEKIFGNL